MAKQIELELDQNLKSFIPEIIFKLLLGVFAVFLVNVDNQYNPAIELSDLGTGVFTLLNIIAEVY